MSATLQDPQVGNVLRAGSTQYFPGHVRGRRQPTLAVTLTGNWMAQSPSLEPLSKLWRARFPGLDPAEFPAASGLDLAGLGMWAGAASKALLRGLGLPLTDPVTAVRSAVDNRHSVTLLLPAAPGVWQATEHAWVQVVALLASYQASPGSAARHWQEALSQITERLRPYLPKGANTPRFLQAAYDLSLPILALGPELYQYGQGARARWLNSTFTDQTPNVGAQLARNKAAAAARLRQAGLPVAAHAPANSAEHAVQLAQRIGYPVVIKPADRDGGSGVAAQLTDAQEVARAYHNARKISPHVLVEKHIFGRDYRLTVMNGELIWSIERIPAGVTGNGKLTIAELVNLANAEPGRGEGPHARLKRLQLDAEAIALLGKNGLSPQSVPAEGVFVPLRSIANVATGGYPVAVNEQVHPDNAELAIRAASALRLDLAGIDLLIPSISDSWREVESAICEINAQPQLGMTTGPHLYGEILQRLHPPPARIPILAVLGAPEGCRLAETLAQGWAKQSGRQVGWSDERGVAINDQWLSRDAEGSFAAGQMLLTHHDVEALVLSVADDDVSRYGLPVDAVDWLLIAGDTFQARHAPGRDGKQRLREALSSLLPICQREVVHWMGTDIRIPQQAGLCQAAWLMEPLTDSQLIERLNLEALRD